VKEKTGNTKNPEKERERAIVRKQQRYERRKVKK